MYSTENLLTSNFGITFMTILFGGIEVTCLCGDTPAHQTTLTSPVKKYRLNVGL